MFVCAELVDNECTEWVTMFSWLPDLLIEDALTLASAIVALWALAWAWKKLRSAV